MTRQFQAPCPTPKLKDPFSYLTLQQGLWGVMGFGI